MSGTDSTSPIPAGETHVTGSPDSGDTSDMHQALAVARSLVKAGVPVFVAPPADEPGTYRIPKGWQHTRPSLIELTRWRVGWALGMVGGHGWDVLDIDPRNGGNQSWQQLREQHATPTIFGSAATPSGGLHHIIAGTGLRKVTGFLPGLDLQAGDSKGVGRGFAWIAPTVRVAKAGERAGELVPYRWERVPVIEGDGLLIGQEKSRTFIAYVKRKTAKSVTVDRTHERVVAADDPFITSSQRVRTQSFTPSEAMRWCQPALDKLASAQIGDIENQCNNAAVSLAHFVPAIWTPQQAFGILEDALSHTSYTPRGPHATWNASKFMPVLDGTRTINGSGSWKAVRSPKLSDVVRASDGPRLNGAAVESSATDDGENAEELSEVDKLLAEMLTEDDLVNMPTPEPLINGVLNLDSEAWLIGAPGSRKSFVALDMAARVASGRMWQGCRVKQGPVVYIAAEGASGLGTRVRAWRKTYGGIGDGLRVLPRPVQAGSARDGLNREWFVLIEACRRLEPALVVIDTQARVTLGLKENSADEMGVYIAAVSALRSATSACVLTVHHTGRTGQDARGSSAIDGAQGTELRVTVEGAKHELRGKLHTDKQKDMEESEEGLLLQFQRVDLEADKDGRELGSLVLMDADPFISAQIVNDSEAWVSQYPGVVGQALRVLVDQGGTIGLTKAEVRRGVMDRWYGGRYTRDGEGLRYSTWDKAWTALRESVGASGGQLLVNVSGQRWAVDTTVAAELDAERAEG